jgi:hypothetical protein
MYNIKHWLYLTVCRIRVIHNLSNYVYFSCSELSGAESEMLGDTPDPVADTRNSHVSERKKHMKKGKGK